MADNQDNPLLKALPPQTDYLSYLTILEYNLTAPQLPILHEILQDTTLTTNIGWDLVHLLLPLLPASRQCLQDVARLGNPREVVLKVTELLEAIRDEEGVDEENGQDEEAEDFREVEEEPDERKDPAIVTSDETKSAIPVSNAPQAQREPVPLESDDHPGPPSKTLRFTSLVEMLSVLHPRIKTKYPSRFLSTSLQAVLPAFSQLARAPSAMEAVLDLIKSISGTQRPKLPPRKSSSQVHTLHTLKSAPDPEGQDEILGEDETSLQQRLLQSFLTFVTESFVSSIATGGEVPGLAWSIRYQEKMHPERIVTGRRSHIAMFAEDESLQERETLLGLALATARDLRVSPEELLAVITEDETNDTENTDELPSKASDVPLARLGSLYIFSAIAASSTLYDFHHSLPPMHLFPDFAEILNGTLNAGSQDVIGTEPEGVIDSVLFLGFYILNEDAEINPGDDEVFNDTLQRLSLLSANTYSPTLRYQAHVLTSSILRLHPSDQVRLSFIKDTIEHCPYESVKASAVGWLKDEILAAEKVAEKADVSIFATPAVLTSLEPLLFLNPELLAQDRSDAEGYEAYQMHQPFYLAVLNMLYLLLLSPSLKSRLELDTRVQQYTRFLDSLLSASKKYNDLIAVGELGQIENRNNEDARLARTSLLEQTVHNVMDVIT